MTAANVQHAPEMCAQGTYHQDGGVQQPTYLPAEVAAAVSLLGSPARARLLHVLLRQSEPILTSALAREAGLQYRPTLSQLQKLEEAGAVEATISLEESRQGRELRWSVSTSWLADALEHLNGYLTPPSVDAQ